MRFRGESGWVALFFLLVWSGTAFAADTIPYDGIVREDPADVIASTREPRPRSPRQAASCVHTTSELAITSNVIAICAGVADAFACSPTSGISAPNASE